MIITIDSRQLTMCWKPVNYQLSIINYQLTKLWQKKTVATKKRVVKVGANGQLHVHSSFNNIIITLANSEGQVISWSSAGKMGFRSSKKNTPYAAQMAAQDCAKVAYDLGLRKVKAYVKGPGNGRESAIRTVHGAGIEVTEIIDVTPLPHNGCRPPKRRRVKQKNKNTKQSIKIKKTKKNKRIKNYYKN